MLDMITIAIGAAMFALVYGGGRYMVRRLADMGLQSDIEQTRRSRTVGRYIGAHDRPGDN